MKYSNPQTTMYSIPIIINAFITIFFMIWNAN
jgi:hypothetical protein